MWIQTGVTVRKRLNGVMTSVTLTFDLWPWPFAWTSLLLLVITLENLMIIWWWEHSQKGVTDRRTNGRKIPFIKLLGRIAGTLGCVFIDNKTHESGVTKCTTGEAWSAFSWHHSSVFHCQWTHNQVFLLLSHMLIENAKSIFIYVMKYVSGFIWKLGINFAVFIKWIDETWWNNRLLLMPNCYEVVAMVATMVAMVALLWCHTLR